MKINAIEIKNFRNKYRLTQSELAELVGVSYRTIQNYEKGVPIPKSKVQLFQRIFEGYKDSGNELREELLEGKRRAATGLTIEDVSLDEIARFVIIHDTELMENKIFQMYIENKQSERAFEILSGEVHKPVPGELEQMKAQVAALTSLTTEMKGKIEALYNALMVTEISNDIQKAFRKVKK